MTTPRENLEGVITAEEALNVLKKIQVKVNELTNAEDKENYNRVLGQAFAKLTKANNLKEALISINGVINTAEQISKRKNNDESVLKANQDISDLANGLKARIKQIPDKPKFESAIDEVASSERVFRGEMTALKGMLDRILNNKNIAKNPELRNQVDKIIRSIDGVMAETSFDNLIKQDNGNYSFNTAVFQGYLGKIESLINESAQLLDDKKNMSIIAKQVFTGKEMADLDRLLIQPTQRVPRFTIMFNEINDKIKNYNEENPNAKKSVNGLSDALTMAGSAGVNVNESKRQREFIAESLQKLSTYNDRRLGAGHKKEKAELASFISAMKKDPSKDISSYREGLLQKLQQQLSDINKNKKPNQKEGKYTKLLEGMISDVEKQIKDASQEKQTKLPSEISESIKSSDGKLDSAFIKENWPLFVNGDFSKNFADNIMPTLSDAQLFNLTQSLMTAHLTSDNKNDSMLRANGHLSGMLYKEMAKRTGYDPLANPDKPAPAHMNVLNNLVYKNIDGIQRAKAEQVKAKAGAGMQVGSAEDYAKSIKKSAATAILFAFDPTEPYLKNGGSDPQKITEFKQHFQSVSNDSQSVDALLNADVTSDAVPSLPENYFTTGEPVNTATISSESDIESNATYSSEFSEDSTEEVELEDEFDVDMPSADDIVAALNKHQEAKQQESDDLKAFLEGGNDPAPVSQESKASEDLRAFLEGHDEPEEEAEQEWDMSALNDALKTAANKLDELDAAASKAEPEPPAHQEAKGRELKDAIHQEEKGEMRPQQKSRADKMAERLAKLKEKKEAYQTKVTAPDNPQAKTAEPAALDPEIPTNRGPGRRSG